MRLPPALVLAASAALFTLSAAAQTWTFAVSGDSRNCGDIAMPSIAAAAQQAGAAFYWHIGDYRALYAVDEDISGITAASPSAAPADLDAYRDMAWGDFKLHQLGPFGATPVFLARGNHEEAGVRTRNEYICAFSKWLDQPAIRAQRLQDDPQDTAVRTYYHWIQGGVDFITLDNASDEQFEPDQMKWFEGVLARAAANPDVKSVVVGMHRALPDSESYGHSMNETPAQTASGRKAYADLVAFHRDSRKLVYLLASHSHYFMPNLYDTACRREHPDQILPGWLIGTAGAQRYRLPADHPKGSETGVYGLLIGTVSADGSIQFEFKKIGRDAVTPQVRDRYSSNLIDWCFDHNASQHPFPSVPTPPNCPAPVK